MRAITRMGKNVLLPLGSNQGLETNEPHDSNSSAHGKTNRKKTFLFEGFTGRNIWFVALDPANVNQEFVWAMSTEFVSMRQPV